MADFFSAGARDERLTQGQNQASTQTPSFGNLSFFEQGFPGLYQPSGSEQNILNSIVGLSGQPRYTPEMSRGIQAIQGLLGPAEGSPNFTSDLTTAMNSIKGLMDAGIDPRALQTIQQLLQMAMQGPSQLETQGLGTLRGRTDPTALTSAAERYMREIGEPSARAASVAGGMGGVRGGAFQEGLARESARLALPIAEMIQRAQGELGGAELGVGAGLEARRGNLATLLETVRQGQVAEKAGLANQLFGMRQAADQRQAALAQMLYGMGQGDSRASDLGLLTAGASAAAVPRLGGIQDLLRQQQLAMMQRGISTTGTTAGTSRASMRQPFTVGNLIQPLTTIAAASLLGPQGAEASGSKWNWLSSLLSNNETGGTLLSPSSSVGDVLSWDTGFMGGP